MGLRIRFPHAAVTMVCMSRDRKYTLVFWGGLAMFVAFLLGVGVIANPAVAQRLYGTMPPGTVLSGVRAAAVASIVAAGSSVAAVFASRLIIPILLVLAACAPLQMSSPARTACAAPPDLNCKQDTSDALDTDIDTPPHPGRRRPGQRGPEAGSGFGRPSGPQRVRAKMMLSCVNDLRSYAVVDPECAAEHPLG